MFADTSTPWKVSGKPREKVSVHYSFYYLSYLSRIYLFFSYILQATKEESRKIEDEFEEKGLDDVEETKKKEEPPKKDFKYYFNRFRYYHYRVAETVDYYCGIIGVVLLKIIFFLMGYRVNGNPSIDEMMDIEDD